MTYSILDAIGNTPLVEIKRLNPNPNVKIYAKIEYMNPGGSVKDRPALAMIEEGEKSGDLTPEKTVIEATSGNTGIGLAMICSIKGYNLLLAMSEAVSMERRQILKARGAEIMLTPGHLGTDGAIEEVYRLVREEPDRYFMTDQYNNPANWMAHYNTTAPEIIAQTGGKIDTFVATMGTTGTLMGCSRRFREHDPAIRIIGVEPYLGHKLQGLKNMKEAYQPELYKKRLLDDKVNVDDEEAFDMTRRLGREEGLFVGMSSGAAMLVAAREAEKMESGTIVMIFPDSGERYLSTTLFAVKKKADIAIYNSMSRSKELFEPLREGNATVYTCGPTVYRRINLGECRRFIFSDLLCRYLEYRGIRVNHVMNITDIDDKTIAAAEAAGESLADFTGRHIDLFNADLISLNIKPADHYPRAGEHVDDMVDVARKLYEKGYAYEKLRSLYFNISAVADYGQLSGIDLDKIKLGATVDLDEYEKNNPRDFTLFKRARLSELKKGYYVKTPWGNVRPSWHIQCAAMSMKYLGETYDIHSSTRELIFPHHENERAIARALTGKPLARYWIHCERILAEESDGTANGNLLPALETLFEKGYGFREIRYWLITSHYRSPVRFSEARLVQSKNALKRIDTFVRSLQQVKSDCDYPEIDQLLYDLRQGFVSAMDDNLNMPRAMAALFDMIKRINKLVDEDRIGKQDAEKIFKTLKGIDSIIAIFHFETETFSTEAKALINTRDAARKAGDFERADRIREQLKIKGIHVQDTKKVSDK